MNHTIARLMNLTPSQIAAAQARAAAMTELELKDRYSGQRVFLVLREGTVVGALGCEPARYIGLTEQAARHKARYSRS